MDKEFESLLKEKPINNIPSNKDICLELLNQFLLGDIKRYQYMCEIFNKEIFGMEHYKKGCTTSKTKLFIIRLIKKLNLEEEAKIIRDIFKDIIKLLKKIARKIINLFKGSE